jgi:hypothetical protein
MESKKYTLTDFVQKMVGSIEPVGESHTDTKRLENLKVMVSLVEDLTREIYEVHQYNKDCYEHSKSQAAKYALAFFEELQECYGDVFKDKS